MEEHLHFKYRDIVADAGYESEENYLFLEKNGQSSYIKPTNYEISRTRKYRTDISCHENMSYDKETDSYTCRNGRKLCADGFRQYLYRGMKNALAESVLVAIAYNFNKLHWKIQSQKQGIRLYELNKTA